MANPRLEANARTEFGKGAARRTRRAGQIPAVIYGHGTDPVHLALPGQETFLTLRQANVLLEIIVDGGKPVMALPRQIQRDPITGGIDHVDLIIVKAGEKVSVEVALEVVGEAERGSLVNVDLNSLTVFAPATDIPEVIEVDIEGLVIGDQILVGDLKLPEGVEAQLEADVMVLNVTPPPVVVEETEAAEGEEAAEGDAEAASEDA